MKEINQSSNFIRNIMIDDLKSGKHTEIITRFPPEPNGYLHIGHVKSININFELAAEFNGKTNLRFDDTNPLKEDDEYVEAIKKDVVWLGYEWSNLLFASDYFEEMYERALLLIKKGKAYVCDLSAEAIREYRGSFTKVGIESPYRNRPVEENLDLFEKMRKGKFADGEKVLRARIDMSSPNLNMRDPVLYRIAHAEHHNTGNKWCIYPMYDYAHPLEDAIEGITHSICTIEFEDHRPLYDWVVAECEMEHVPQQIEFGKLAITNTIMGKRKLKQLVEGGYVDGWDDPRIYTISALRRRGVTPNALKNFVRETGISKNNAEVDVRMLEHFIRDDLRTTVPRTMSVLDPLKVVITNYPEGQIEMLDSENNSDNPEMGVRQIPFSRELYIEREDFMEDPPSKYHRLYPGNEVRLKNAYFITCNDVIKDDNGEVIELRCTYDSETKSGSGFTGRKVKGTIHWVDANGAVPAEFRLYDDIVVASTEDNDEDEDKSFLDDFNHDSIQIMQGYIEANMINVKPGDRFQFFRHGYFAVDPKYTTNEKPVFNRIVALKSSFEINK